jgi:hypothetical protein
MKSSPPLQAQWKDGLTSLLGKHLRTGVNHVSNGPHSEKAFGPNPSSEVRTPAVLSLGALTEAVYSGGDST